MTAKDTAKDIVAELKKLGTAQTKKTWMNHGAQEPCLGVKELREIKTLQMLEIRSPKVTDAALKDLQTALPKLKLRRASPGETPFAAFAEKK